MAYATTGIIRKGIKRTGRAHPGNGAGISLLEKENSLQRQLIEKLKEENSVLEKHAQKYLETMRKMLEDIHQ